MVIYLNGAESAKKTIGLTPLHGPAITLIGRDADDRPAADHIRGFRGWIDELRISSVARTEFSYLHRQAGGAEVREREARMNSSANPPAEWVTFKVITPDGRVLLEKDNWVGHESFKVAVPPAAVGKVWKLVFRNGEDATFAFSPHVPGWLASQPSRLIVPEKYLAQ